MYKRQGVGQAPIRVNDLYNIKNGASDGKTKYAAIDECIAYTCLLYTSRLTAAAPIPPPWPLLTGERLFRIRQEAGRGGRKRIIIINRYRAGHDRDGNRFPG